MSLKIFITKNHNNFKLTKSIFLVILKTQEVQLNTFKFNKHKKEGKNEKDIVCINANCCNCILCTC